MQMGPVTANGQNSLAKLDGGIGCSALLSGNNPIERRIRLAA